MDEVVQVGMAWDLKAIAAVEFFTTLRELGSGVV